MISKEQFCKILVDKFEKAENRKAEEFDTLKSSGLAVAMEFLGMLKDPMYVQYASERAGVLYTYFDEEKRGMAMFTVREMIDLLPDEVELRTE